MEFSQRFSTMRIGQLSRTSGLGLDTIRFYEREGLISSLPSDSDTNSYRIYPDDLTERLAMISEARNAGMSIADIRLLLNHMEGDAPEDFDANQWIADRIAELRRKIADSERFLTILEATQDALDRAVSRE